MLGAVAFGVIVVMTLVVVRVTTGGRLQSWMAFCEARSGTVQTRSPGPYNPLVAESDDPTYRCRSNDGRLVSTWR